MTIFLLIRVIPVLLLLIFPLVGAAQEGEVVSAAQEEPEASAAKEEPAAEPPPLPLHTIEGVGGIFATSSAYLVNPAKEGKLFGKPSLGTAFVYLGYGRWLGALTATETLGDRLELGYGWNYLDLGDLRGHINSAVGVNIGDNRVKMHNVNARLALLKEGQFDLPWLPAVTFGTHFKINEDIDGIDDDLFGALSASGIASDYGFDFTLYASKMITSLPRPVLLNVGVRNSDAAHLGFLGFTRKRKFLAEGNVVVFLTDRLALGAEYRMKPNEYKRIGDLVQPEDDWWTIVFAYVFNSHLTISGGYGHFGRVLQHNANGSWGIKTKWEF